MKILNSPLFSLICAGLNAYFAINSFSHGSWGFGVLAAVFSLFCLNNYIQAIK